MSQFSKAEPVILTLPAGTHWVCACGQSKNYPYCDGAHKGSAFAPIELSLDSAKTVEITP